MSTISRYRRRRTRVVQVGDVGIGGDNPIRVQSMTTPATTDTEATVAQIGRLVDAGCEIVRLTVPSKADAENLPNIRREMQARGIRVPLVADIHFTPAAAMLAVEYVEKVRVNPGNFADKKRFAEREYTDAEYAAELERIRDRFVPLVRRAAELGVAIRIGTNHGSLSDRIMNRYGDTPLGMVESALEFIRVARDEGFHALVPSMKSSNPLVAIEAYRLLVEQMDAEGMDYPLHLGVTEAGDGEDARIKSAVGIGTLLDEGIGDTIRVSLTEDPVAEVPVAFAIAAPYNARLAADLAAGGPRESPASADRATQRARAASSTEGAVSALGQRRKTAAATLGPYRFGGGDLVRNEIRLRTPLAETDTLHWEIADVAGYSLAAEKKAELLLLDVATAADADALVELAGLFDRYDIGVPLAARLTPAMVTLVAAEPAALDPLLKAITRVSGLPPVDLGEAAWNDAVTALAGAARDAGTAVLVEAHDSDVPTFIAPEGSLPERLVDTVVRAVSAARGAGASTLAACWTTVEPGPTATARLLVERLDRAGLDVPHLALDLGGSGRDVLLRPSIDLGALLADGLVDAIRVESPLGAERDVRFAYDVLQGTRQRVVKTEFIACPSCGRTLFDLEEVTHRIRAKTGHLKGLKIAIMGCIVNGPGEMADADFGYVGWGPGKVALFHGKEMVAKDVPAAVADQRLIELIQAEGRWLEPPAPA